MANLIQIKRSLNTANPTSLANGELAFSANGDVLFIGSNSAVVPIGGKRTPGVLTANQALVANATLGIDKVIVANASITRFTANGVSSPGAGYLLSVDGGGNTYWLPQSSVSINTAAQFSWSNTHAFTVNVASSNTTTGSVVITGGLGVSGRINTNDLAAGNDSVYSTLTGTTLTIANVFASATVNAAVLSVGGWVIANQSGVFTSGIVNADIVAVGTSFRANTTKVTIGSGVGLVANGSVGTANQVLKSDGTSVYWDTDAGDISSVTAGDGLTGGGTTGAVTLNVVGANGINVTADAVGVTTGTTLTVNTSGIHVNNDLFLTSLTATGLLTVEGNTTLGNANADIVTFNAEVASNIVPSANATYSLGTNADRWLEVHAANVHTARAYIEGNIEVGGDLLVTGNLVTQNVSSVIISDPLIYLAGNNYSSDLVDIGFVANYNDGTNRHTGLFRDASDDGKYKLFSGLTQELDSVSVVNTADPSFAIATLKAYLDGGALQANATSVYITANSTVNVNITANTLTLTTPLAATSGGIGQNSYNAGDLIYASNSTYLDKLALGTSGKVLQSNGSAVVYADLDGGTF